MKRLSNVVFATFICTNCLCSGFSAASTEDWSCFCGPNRTGIKEGGARTPHVERFRESSLEGTVAGTRVLQPDSGGGPALRHLLHRNGTEEGSDDLGRSVPCLSRETGDALWKVDLKEGQPEDEARGYLTEHGYAGSSPVSDGERVFVFFGKRGLYAFACVGVRP